MTGYAIRRNMLLYAVRHALAHVRFAAAPREGAGAAKLRLGLISEGTNTWPLYVAQSRGLFEREGLHVEATVVGSSVKQQQALIGGSFDIGFQQADHVVRAVEQGADLVAFAAQAHAPDVTLVAAPGVGTLGELRGKTIGVDGAGTGYALLLRRLLEQHGIGVSDLALAEIGGSQERFDALRGGAAAACMLNAPFDANLIAAGYTALARMGELFPTYPGPVMAARRSWAQMHRRELAAFARVMDDAYRWLQQPANRAEALNMLPERLALAPRGAAAALERFATRERPQITAEGMCQVIDVVWEAEGYAARKGSPDKYMDASYAQERRA